MEEQDQIIPINEVRPRVAPLIADLVADGEKARKASEEAMQLAADNKPVVVPEITLWDVIKDKADGLLNVKGSPMTSTVGVGAALVCYYEAFDYFMSDRSFQAWMKVGQGTFALAVGIISKDPQSIFKPKQ